MRQTYPISRSHPSPDNVTYRNNPYITKGTVMKRIISQPIEVEVCDRCGEPATEQSKGPNYFPANPLGDFQFLGKLIRLHPDCRNEVEKTVRPLFGLLSESKDNG